MVIALPEDMLEETVTDAAPILRIQAHPGAGPLSEMRELLATAERPLMLVGGGDWNATASDDIRAFARANTLPAVASFRAQDITAWANEARADYEATLHHGPMPGLLDLGEVFAHLRERLPRDTIITNGAGNYSAWCHRFLQFSSHRSQIAPVNGTMG